MIKYCSQWFWEGFWEGLGGGGRIERNIIDIGIFNPHAPLNKQLTLTSCYRKYERLKKKNICRVIERNSTCFVHLISTVSNGGIVKEEKFFFNM